jgi:hypothetical protein
MGTIFGKEKPLKEVLRENKRMVRAPNIHCHPFAFFPFGFLSSSPHTVD